MVLDEIFAGLVLIFQGNSEIWMIITLSIFISGTAISFSSLIGIPLGVLIANKWNNRLIAIILNSFLGIPPVVLGLFLYILFSQDNIFGWLNILFTPLLMMLSQFLLTLPIIVSITRTTISELPKNIPTFFLSLGATNTQTKILLLKEAKGGVLIGIIVAFSRAIGEVGALLLIGGNIRGSTRVLSTTIVTETNKGNFGFALGLGIFLMSLTFIFSSLITWQQFNKIPTKTKKNL